jgi:aldehyde:ferredoxin oxidoreductase
MKGFPYELEEPAVKAQALLYDYGDGEETLLHDEVKSGGRGAKHIEAVQQRVRQITGTDRAFQFDEYEGKPELVVYMEDLITVNDCLSACKLCSSFYYAFPFSEKYQTALFSAGTGIETSEDTLFQLAKRVANIERAYCVREGMTRDMDSLPKRFMDRTVNTGKYKGSMLKSKEFERMKDRYYTLRGWNVATGVPTRDTLEQAGLGDVAQDLEKRGKLARVDNNNQNDGF